MIVIIGAVAALFFFLAACLIFLPLTLSIFIGITVGSFIAFQLLQNPAAVSRLLAHVQQTAPELWRRLREISAPEVVSSPRELEHPVGNSVNQNEPISTSFRTRGKENIAEYVRPVMRPRRFTHSVTRNEFQGQSPRPSPSLQTLKNPATNSLWSPIIPTRPSVDGNSFVPIINLDEKHSSFSRLPLSPIFPSNKSVNSPDLDLGSSMLRFNSGQDSILHPSMHYPTHQPDLVASPGILPSVSWLNRDGALSSPRHRKGLPRVQSPVMVRIASPLPDRPASPLFRKLASEEKKDKSSSSTTDKVIMAIRQRQKRSAQDVEKDAVLIFPLPEEGKVSKRRKLDSTSGKVTPTFNLDVDMDLGHNPLTKGMKNVFSASSKHGITTPTRRNPIMSSFSSTLRTQGMLKRRKDTDSVEVEEEEGVSPIKKSVPRQHPSQSPQAKTPGRKTNVPHQLTRFAADSPSALSPLRSGGKALYFEKNKEVQNDGKDTEDMPSTSGLKKKVMFTPQRKTHVQRVDTPGEYTAADKEEDRAQARQRVSYLKEMLMADAPTQSPQGTAASDAAAKPQMSLFSTPASQTTTTPSLPALSVAPLANTTATSATSAATSSATATTTPSLGLLGVTGSSSLFSKPATTGSDKKSLSAPAPLTTSSTTAATTLATSAASTTLGGGSGFKLATTSAAATSQASLAAGGTLNIQGLLQSKPTLGNTNPLGGSLGAFASGTQVDAKAPATSAAATGPVSQSSVPSGTINGGFSLGGQAPGQATSFGGGSSTFGAAAAASAAAAAATSSTTTTTTGASTQPQFKPIFGAPSATGSSAPSQSAPQATSNPSQPQVPSGGFQFGQSSGSTPSKGGFAFGNQQASATGSILSGVATPFQAAAAPTSSATFTQNQQTSSSSATINPASGGPTFAPIFGQPKSTQPSSTASAQAPSFFGGAPAPTSTGNPSAPGGFNFGAATTSSSASAATAPLSFGGANAATTKATSSTTFGSTAPAFGAASNPASSIGASIFGAKPTQGASLQPQASASATGAKPGGLFGAPTAQQAPAFGTTPSANSNAFGATTTPNATNNVFGGSMTPSTQNSSIFGGAGTNKPAFGTPTATNKPAFGGNPTATVTPFGSGTTQTANQTASPFQFGGSQTPSSSQPAQQPASGGFGFGGTKPAGSFNFGSPAPAAAAAPSTGGGFSFGQATPTQPSGGATQQTNFFNGSQGASPAPSQFNAAPSFGGSPAPAFGMSPTPGGGGGFPAPGGGGGGGGFSIGAGAVNPNTNQRRANRLRQVRSRAGRR